MGKDPSRIEELTGLLYRASYWRTGPVLQSAVSAVEMALWDIKGKHYGAPVYDLLGGKVRDGIRMYANGWFAGAKTPEEFAQKAEEAVPLGVTALKWDPFGKAYLTLCPQTPWMPWPGYMRTPLSPSRRGERLYTLYDFARLLEGLRGLRPAGYEPLRRHF